MAMKFDPDFEVYGYDEAATETAIDAHPCPPTVPVAFSIYTGCDANGANGGALLTRICGGIKAPYDIVYLHLGDLEGEHCVAIYEHRNWLSHAKFTFAVSDVVSSAGGTQCGGELTGSSGTITPPGYPHGYAANVDCTWRIRRPPGHTIELSVTALDLGRHRSRALFGRRCLGDYLLCVGAARAPLASCVVIHRLYAAAPPVCPL